MSFVTITNPDGTELSVNTDRVVLVTKAAMQGTNGSGAVQAVGVSMLVVDGLQGPVPALGSVAEITEKLNGWPKGPRILA